VRREDVINFSEVNGLLKRTKGYDLSFIGPKNAPQPLYEEEKEEIFIIESPSKVGKDNKVGTSSSEANGR